ncbi:hypothetical protein ACOSP7_015049 [Xanthoceras sorbifolium]
MGIRLGSWGSSKAVEGESGALGGSGVELEVKKGSFSTFVAEVVAVSVIGGKRSSTHLPLVAEKGVAVAGGLADVRGS